MTIMLQDEPERVFATPEAKKELKAGNLAPAQTKQKVGKRRAAMLCTTTNAAGEVVVIVVVVKDSSVKVNRSIIVYL
jgi:hypothetical protein